MRVLSARRHPPNHIDGPGSHAIVRQILQLRFLPASPAPATRVPGSTFADQSFPCDTVQQQLRPRVLNVFRRVRFDRRRIHAALEQIRLPL